MQTRKHIPVLDRLEVGLINQLYQHIHMVPHNRPLHLLVVLHNVLHNTLRILRQYQQLIVFLQHTTLNFTRKHMSFQLAEIRLVKVVYTHSEWLIQRSHRKWQLSQSISDRFCVNSFLSLEMSVNLFCYVDSVECTHRNINDLLLSESDMVQVKIELFLDNQELFSIPVNQVHLVHRYNDLKHSQGFYNVCMLFGLASTDER